MKHIEKFENYFIKESTMSGIDQMIMIEEISSMIESKGGSISAYELTLESSPVYRDLGNEIHLVERFDLKDVGIISYGGYKYEQELEEYNVRYEDLSSELILEIYDLLKSALQD